jgi:uncharacterized protein (DUF1800 family)
MSPMPATSPTASPMPSGEACSLLPTGQRGPCKRRGAEELQLAWLSTLTWGSASTPAPVARQVQLWCGVFPVHWRQVPDAQLLEGQLATIQRHLGGSFAQLLSAMLLDPALQLSLNGPSNHRRRPNENLARELLELFSLGEGNYSERDVREAARALTGYRLDGERRLVLEPRRHDAGSKTILGRTAAWDGASLALWLAEQPATARHITSRLWRHTIGTTPAPARLEAIAADWRRQQLSLPWLMQTLARIPEAEASRRQGLRLADPLELMSRSLRVLGSRHADALAISLRGLRAMGQAPFEPPSVKGWPVNEQWLQLRWLQARRQTLQQLLADEEVWDSRNPPSPLPESLTSRPPLTLPLPATGNRETLGRLFADPVWQLA